MNLQESIRRIFREELDKKQKVFYTFSELKNHWVDDNDRSYHDEFFDNKDYEDFHFDNFYDMDEMFGHENSLFGTRGLPVGHPDRSSKSFDYYNKKFGPMIVRVIKNNDLQESIRRILREEIEFNYGQDLFDYHKKENLPYHSKYKRGESIDYYKKHFIDEVKKHIVEDNQILLYRVVATKKEKDIKKPFGTYWAFKKEDSQVIDWENIKDTDDLKLFRITALFNLSDINWKDSFDLYLMNDFMESEIRVNYGANPEEYFIDEL